jgi:hypothetical protein
VDQHWKIAVPLACTDPAVSTIYRPSRLLLHAALFLSAASLHCVALNLSPLVRRVFSLRALPPGLSLLLLWTLLAMAHALAVTLRRLLRLDLVQLLRAAAWLWLLAFLQPALPLLPLPTAATHALLGVSYGAAVLAHGLLLPAATLLLRRLLPRTEEEEAGEVEAVGVGVGLAAAGFVQLFYFAFVDLEPPDHALLVLPSARASGFSLSLFLSTLLLVIVILYQSRGHSSATPSSSETQPQNVRRWLRLTRRSVPLVGLAIALLLLLLAVPAVLLVHAAATSPLLPSLLIGLCVLLGLAWLAVILLATSQLAPRPRASLFASLPSSATPTGLAREQLFAALALACLACFATRSSDRWRVQRHGGVDLHEQRLSCHIPPRERRSASARTRVYHRTSVPWKSSSPRSCSASRAFFHSSLQSRNMLRCLVASLSSILIILTYRFEEITKRLA